MHGMGHNPNKKYWQHWGKKLQPYLIKKGLDPAQINFNGIYYYDLVPQPGDGWNKLSSIFKRDVLEQLQQDFREQLVRGDKLTQLLGRGPIKTLVNLVADNFGDIFSYMLNDSTYKRVNNRFYASIEQVIPPITLIAYSLGSMISYCALQQRPELVYQVNHFITLGSPIFWFRKWLAIRANLSERPTAAHWTNLAGIVDVACPHLVSYSTCGADSNIQWDLEKFNPIKGHLAYFNDPEALSLLASTITKNWRQ
ncbi:hypothetical protein JCM14036_14520 [Desulfotomaculum defluvii]